MPLVFFKESIMCCGCIRPWSSLLEERLFIIKHVGIYDCLSEDVFLLMHWNSLSLWRYVNKSLAVEWGGLGDRQIMALPEFSIFSKMFLRSELPRSSPAPLPQGSLKITNKPHHWTCLSGYVRMHLDQEYRFKGKEKGGREKMIDRRSAIAISANIWRKDLF